MGAYCIICISQLASLTNKQNKEWTLIASGTGSTAETLDLTNYNEIFMNYKPSGSGATVGNMILPKIVLDESEKIYYPAGPPSQAGAVGGLMRISLTSARVTSVHVNGADKTSTCPFYVYAR